MAAGGHSGASGKLPARSGDAERAAPHPGELIAIVGMACRLPGGEDLAAFWRQLHAGESAVIERSADSGGRHDELLRDGVVQHDSLRFFGFIPGIDQFDAEFFRIAPLEAEMLDPQQRLLLETSWHALEDAGIDPEGLSESRTGVYAGISSNDYGDLARHVSGGARSLYLATGNAYSTASGRVSFLLGLKGPAIATDTACSSSLVALHQAVTGLQSGETDMALVGGVAALLAPAMSESFASAGMLSPTGRCWTFDEAADGFVRAEGCGVVVLKRLAEAEAAGDRIWAVIRGSAVNQDGASGGLTVPSGEAQERVIEEALDRAGLEPTEVDYLEAHGTGTKVGDPTELGAAAAVYGKGRDPDHPLLIGSVKTNIGHMSAGAGMAGLIKTVLALHQGVIPKHLNFSNPNSRIDWERLPIRVTSTMTDWPAEAGRPPRAGVNSFGFSGTNAHVLVEGHEAPDGDGASPGGRAWPVGPSQAVAISLPESLADSAPAEPFTERGVRLLPLSGKSGRRSASWRSAIARGSTSMPRNSPRRTARRTRCSPTWPGRRASDAATSRTARVSPSATPPRCATG